MSLQKKQTKQSVSPAEDPPAPASGPLGAWSAPCPQSGCWCSPCRRRPAAEKERESDGDSAAERKTKSDRQLRGAAQHSAPYLLVPGDASVHGRVYDSVQAHAEWVDVAVMLPVLVLADQGAQLLGLVLHHVNGVLQGAHLHLGLAGWGGGR